MMNLQADTVSLGVLSVELSTSSDTNVNTSTAGDVGTCSAQPLKDANMKMSV